MSRRRDHGTRPRGAYAALAWTLCTLGWVVALAAAAREASGALTAPHLANWSAPVAGAWTDGARWSTTPAAPLNGSPAADDRYVARIDAAGNPYVVLLSSDVSVDRLVLEAADATLQHDAGVLETVEELQLRAGRYQLDGGTLTGVRVVGSGGVFETRDQSNDLSVLDGVQLDADLTLLPRARVEVRNGLTIEAGRQLRVTSQNNPTYLAFVGDQALAGAGELVFDNSRGLLDYNRVQLDSGTTLVFGPELTVRTGTGNAVFGSEFVTDATLVNQGIVSARTPRQPLRFVGGQFVNEGVVEATDGGVVELNRWANRGVFRVLRGGRIELGGTMFGSQLGTLENQGGEFLLVGTLVNDADLTLDAATGSLRMFGSGKILGGAVHTTQGFRLTVTSGELDGVRLAGEALITDEGFSRGVLHVRNGLTLDDGTVTLVSDNSLSTQAELLFRGDQTVGGRGTLRFAEGRGNKIAALTGTLTLGPDVVVEHVQGSAQLGNPDTGLVLQGVVKTATSGGLTIDGRDWVNQGRIEIQPGATVVLQGSVRTGNLGDFVVDPAALPVVVSAEIDNRDAVLDVRHSIGPLQFNGAKLRGGRLTGPDGTELLVGRRGGTPTTWDDVTIDGNLRLLLAEPIFVEHGLRLNGRTLALTSGASFTFLGPQTLGGQGEIVVNSRPSSTGFASRFQGDDVVIGPDVVVRTGDTASSASLAIEFEGARWTNEGRLWSQTRGHRLLIEAEQFVNRGEIAAADRGIVRVETRNWQNDGELVLDAGVLELAGGGFVNGPDGAIRGVGTIQVQDFITPWELGPGTLVNTGSLLPERIAVQGALRQMPSGSLVVPIVPQPAGAPPTPLTVTGRIDLDGELLVHLPGDLPRPDDLFTVVASSFGITGRFANAATELRTPWGVFDVAYGSRAVVLSNFRAIPEPTAAWLASGALGALAVRRSKRLRVCAACRYGLRPNGKEWLRFLGRRCACPRLR